MFLTFGVFDDCPVCRSDYIPDEPDPPLSDSPDIFPRECQSGMGTSLKYVSSAATMAQLFVIVLQFQLGLSLEKSQAMTVVRGAPSSADAAVSQCCRAIQLTKSNSLIVAH